MAETRHCLVCKKFENIIGNPGCEEQAGFFMRNFFEIEI